MIATRSVLPISPVDRRPLLVRHLLAVLGCSLCSVTGALADPFPTRDQNPLLAGFGLPVPLPAQLAAPGDWQFAADFNWGSSAIGQSRDTETLLVDAETRELRVTLGRGFADRWMWQLQLPYRYSGAGILDGFIDNWHETFGLPDGARDDLPRDQFRIEYRRNGTTLFDADSSLQGLADISAGVGYQLATGPSTPVSLWLSVKLPTGDADKLTGSGATDVALAIAGEHRFGHRWSAFGQLAVTWLGESDLFGAVQRDVVWSGLAGVDVNIWRGLNLKLQLDAHSAAFDGSGIDYLGDAVLLTVGGSYRFQSGWQLDLGVSEDIAVDASPDVVLIAAIRKAVGAGR